MLEEGGGHQECFNLQANDAAGITTFFHRHRIAFGEKERGGGGGEGGGGGGGGGGESL